MNIVILLAGGSGTRLNSSVAKQHIVIKDHQIIEYTLLAFEQSPQVDDIIVVSNPQYIVNNIQLRSRFEKLVDVVPGGRTRIQSVQNAVKYLAEHYDDMDKMLFSDAVRPLVSMREIREVFSLLDAYDAVTTGVEVYETILKTDSEGKLNAIIHRDGVLRQTSPEGYRLFQLKKLYLDETEENITRYQNIGVDQLYDRGKEIGIVRSSPLNFKITTEEDLYYFEEVLRRGFCAITQGIEA